MRFRLSTEKLIMYFISVTLLAGPSCMWLISMPIASISGVKNIQYIFLALLCLMGCFHQGKMRISRRPLSVLSFLILYMLIYLVITRSNPIGYLTKHVLIFVILFFYCSTLVRNKKVGEFAKTFVNVISFVAFISLFFWLFGSVLSVIKGISTTYIWGGNRTTINYFWVYFENQIQATQILGKTVIRNTGIYAEAPGFSGYLIVALAIAIPAERGKYPRKQKVLLLITMLTTLSTKGLIAVLILITLTYQFSHPVKSVSKFIQKVIFSITIITVASIVIYLLLEGKSTTHSFIVRMDVVQAAISTWKNHLLFGTGYQDKSEIVQNFSLSRTNTGLSMGLTILLAQGGIYMVALYAFSFICALRKSRRLNSTIFVRIIIFGIMITFNLLISTFQYDVTTIFIIACGYAFSFVMPLTCRFNERAVLT